MKRIKNSPTATGMKRPQLLSHLDLETDPDPSLTKEQFKISMEELPLIIIAEQSASRKTRREIKWPEMNEKAYHDRAIDT